MSKSRPQSCIELPEDIEEGKKKIAKALTGGRDTLAEHRKHGGQPEKCMIFELLKQHLVEDDKELNKIYKTSSKPKVPLFLLSTTSKIKKKN